MDRTNKSNQHVFKLLGILGTGGLLCTNLLLPFITGSALSIPIIPVSGCILLGGIVLDKLHQENKYEKIFRMCGIENKDGQVPLIIKQTKKEKETTLVIHMPAGISQKDFELKQQQIEQYFNAKVEFGFNKNLILKLIDYNLKTRYNYLFEDCENPLEVYIGECNDGKFILDIEKCPHILMAGETNSGKTSLLDTIGLSLIINSHDLELHLIDFQSVGLGIFEDCKKVKSYGETPNDFDILLDKMEKENQKRLKLFRSVKNKIYIEKLSVWNKKFPNKALPHKIVIVDEFARLSEKEYDDILEKFRTRVSMDRKVGIHYITSMQRPDVKCISGSIKANMPTRIAFKTVTQTDSEVILDVGGAEDIKNAGRFLIKYCGELKEVQALFIEPDKVRNILKQYNGYKTKEELTIEKNKKNEQVKDEKLKQLQEIENQKRLQTEIYKNEKQEIIQKFRKNNTNQY